MQATHLPTHTSCSDESLATLSGGFGHLFDLGAGQAVHRLPIRYSHSSSEAPAPAPNRERHFFPGFEKQWY